MTRKELAEWCRARADIGESLLNTEIEHGDMRPNGTGTAMWALDLMRYREIAARLDPSPELRERQAEAAYNEWNDGLIGCCEEPWSAMGDDFKDRLRQSLDAADEVMP